MYIGDKKIKESKETEEKTISGNPIVEVTFEDKSVQHFSKMMFDKIASKEKSDATQLRDKRLASVLKIVLAVLRDWGVTTGELPYFSVLLNQSLQYNADQALLKLVSKYMPKPKSLDEVDYMTIDRILKDK
jgi:hypothetical protein